METTGNRPFPVIEIGAERFRLAGTIAIFDTLVHQTEPINRYAYQRHRIDRHMLEGAPGFEQSRSAFLAFARHSVLVEHSHDAFDTYLVGRGLPAPLEHPVIDTSALARLVLDLPAGQTPGLARVVEELGLAVSPEHAALGDAEATAAVFRELVRRGRERFGWRTLGEILDVLPRPAIDRSRIEPGADPPPRRPRRRRPSGEAPPPPVPGEASDRPRRRRRGRRGGRTRPAAGESAPATEPDPPA